MIPQPCKQVKERTHWTETRARKFPFKSAALDSDSIQDAGLNIPEAFRRTWGESKTLIMQHTMSTQKSAISEGPTGELVSFFGELINVNPGAINWLINRGCTLLVGIHHFWREHSPNKGTGFINPGSTLQQ